MFESFDAFMINLPLITLVTGVSMLLSWIVIRGAVLSALRRHTSEQSNASNQRLEKQKD